jgi:hypothetical protein
LLTKTSIQWVQAPRADGHEVLRVVDIEELGVSATDPNVLMAAALRARLVLTADQSDFSDPPTDAHPGIIIFAFVTRTGGQVRRAVRRIERSVSSLSGHVAYVSDWL